MIKIIWQVRPHQTMTNTNSDSSLSVIGKHTSDYTFYYLCVKYIAQFNPTYQNVVKRLT